MFLAFIKDLSKKIDILKNIASFMDFNQTK